MGGKASPHPRMEGLHLHPLHRSGPWESGTGTVARWVHLGSTLRERGFWKQSAETPDAQIRRSADPALLFLRITSLQINMQTYTWRPCKLRSVMINHTLNPPCKLSPAVKCPDCWVKIPAAPLPVVWPWACHFTSLCPGLHNHKMGVIKSTPPCRRYRVVLRMK